MEPDALIASLVDGRTSPHAGDASVIQARIASSPFAGRLVKVPEDLRGRRHLGLRLGRVAPSGFAHLAKRVLLELQWRPGTTMDDYVGDLVAAVMHKEARVAVFRSEGLLRAAVLSPNSVPAERLGSDPLPFIVVLYDAEHGTITSGYQVSSPNAVRLPEDTLWLS